MHFHKFLLSSDLHTTKMYTKASVSLTVTIHPKGVQWGSGLNFAWDSLVLQSNYWNNEKGSI